MAGDEGALQESIGTRLKRLRLARGLSQRELASPGVSYAYISRIEAGTRQPSMKALRKLAVKLGVTAEYLETGREIDEAEARELRLVDAEIALRLGDTAAAEVELQTIFEEAVAAADRSVAARARIALALAADERGDHAAAVAGMEEAFAIERPSPLERVDAYPTLGRAYGALGQTAREIQLYEQCLQEIETLEGDHSAVVARYRIYLSYALSDAGELARAQEVLRETLAEIGASDDPYMRVRVYWSMARLAEMEGHSKVALRHARHAIALLEATEDKLQQARAHLLAAWIMNSARDPDGAIEQLKRAERLFPAAADTDDRALLRVEQARAHALRGEGEEAEGCAREAISLLGTQAGAIAGTAHWALARALALRGDIDAADRTFAVAAGILEANRRWREATEACRDWAGTLRDAGRQTQALTVLDRAATLALQLSQHPARTAVEQPH